MCGLVVKNRAYQQLNDNETLLVDLDAWGSKPIATRKLVRSRAFTTIGQTTLNRARLCFER